MLRDIVIGLLIAGAAASWIPDSFWQHLFFTSHPLAAKIWGPIIGPLVAVAAFVCSIGNVPLAAVLWNGGISFGGVVSLIFADLIIVPIIVIYRKYYGTGMALFLTGTFYLTMVAAGYFIELVFTPLHLIPSGPRHASVGKTGISWNYTTWLNIVFLLLAAVLIWRFFTSGGRAMLSMMGGGPDDMAGHDHSGHDLGAHVDMDTHRRRRCTQIIDTGGTAPDRLSAPEPNALLTNTPSLMSMTTGARWLSKFTPIPDPD